MPCLNHPLADAGLSECWVCGQSFCPECLAELQGHAMCAPCKAEAVSRLEQGDAAEVVDGERAPWERIGELGLVSAYVKTLLAVIGSPGAFFSRLDRGVTTYTCLGFPMITQTLVVGVLVGFQFLLAGTFAAFGPDRSSRSFLGASGTFIVVVIVVAMPIVAVITIYFWSGLTHLVLMMTKQATLPFHQTMRGSCYGYAPYIVGMVPCVGVHIGVIWMAVVQVIMVQRMHRTSGGMAALAVLGFPLLVCCGAAVAGFAGVMSAVR